MIDDLYCKIYINAAIDKSELIGRIAGLCNASASPRSIVTDIMIIDVIANDSADMTKAAAENGFVYYPYYLEVEPSDEIDPKAYIESLAILLASLKQDLGDAVASCHFESELLSAGM